MDVPSVCSQCVLSIPQHVLAITVIPRLHISYEMVIARKAMMLLHGGRRYHYSSFKVSAGFVNAARKVCVPIETQAMASTTSNATA